VIAVMLAQVFFLRAMVVSWYFSRVTLNRAKGAQWAGRVWHACLTGISRAGVFARPPNLEKSYPAEGLRLNY